MEQTYQQEHGDAGRALAVSSDGNVAFLATNEGVTPLDFALGRATATFPHTIAIKAMCLSDSNRWLVLAGGDAFAYVWDATTQKLVRASGGGSRVVEAVAISADSRVLVTGDGRPVVWGDDQQDHAIRFWDLESGKELGSLTGHGVNVESLAFSPDGKSIVSGLQDATALVWDVPSSALAPLQKE